MRLETRRVSETIKPTEEIKKENSVKDMKRLIDSLPTEDIDQQWVRENESKEFSFSTPNQKKDNNQRVQEIFAQMDGIGAFGKKIVSDFEKQKSAEEWGKLENLIRGSKQNTSKIVNQQTEMIDSQQLENKRLSEETIEPVDVPPVQPPTIDPVVSPTKEEPKLQETVVIDNAALIEELNNRIDKKYNRLVSELSNLYNSEVINQEANVIRGDLQSLMDIKERSLEELTKVDDALNSLISRFAKLSQKADEIKTTDDFRINQQQKQLNFLRDYQNQLERNYGKYWFGKMSEQEKEQYITLYTAAHNVPREVVEKQIENSIAIAYNEIVSSTKQSSEQQQEAPVVQNSQPQQEQQFKGNYENMIRFNGRQALETLKQIHSGLQSATSEQVAEFNYLYSALSSLSKTKPTNYEEEQQKLTQLYNLTDRIDQLQGSMSNSNGKSK